MTKTGFGWQFLGTICCGLVFAIPFILGYFVVRYIMTKLEERRERIEEGPQVV